MTSSSLSLRVHQDRIELNILLIQAFLISAPEHNRTYTASEMRQNNLKSIEGKASSPTQALLHTILCRTGLLLKFTRA